MSRRNVDLGSGSVGKLLFSLAVPTITSQIVNMLYNLVDRVYIGHMQPVETVGKLALTGVGGVPAHHHGDLRLRGPDGLRRRTPGLHRRRAGRPEGVGADHGQQLHHAGGGVRGADCGLSGVCGTHAPHLRRQRQHHRLRPELYAHLCPGHHLRPGDPGHERLYHRPGLHGGGHEDCADRRDPQYGAGPPSSSSPSAWGSGRGPGHHSIPGGLRGVGAEVPHGQQDQVAPAAGAPAAPSQGGAAGPGPGRFPPSSCSLRRASLPCASTPHC